jgi:hypothetical protein
MVASMSQFLDPAAVSRRHVVLGAMALAAVPMPARATVNIVRTDSLNPALLDRARAALQRHAGVLRHQDRIGLVDFSKASRDVRMTILHLGSQQGVDLLVAHGRGSDPDHSGWLAHFSNDRGSLASSRGAYLTAARYVGVHGDAQRLIGLDPENSNAESRAIVIHGADYVSDELIQTQSKLGRSEGCFALRRDDVALALALLGEGTLLYADRV